MDNPSFEVLRPLPAVPADRAPRIAITGGIGAGKSTVANSFAALGANVVDADQLARKVLAPQTPGLRQVISRFGEKIAPGGVIDRKALAQVVFADEEARYQLEKITHPLIREAALAVLGATPKGSFAVYDVPLLVESDSAQIVDVIVAVECDLQERIRRLIQGRGMALEQVQARLQAQASDEDRRTVAHVVFNNSFSISHGENRVLELFNFLSRWAF